MTRMPSSFTGPSAKGTRAYCTGLREAHSLPDLAGFLRRYRTVDSGDSCLSFYRRGRVTTAIYPGSFDPLTFGHIDILQRSVTPGSTAS